MTTQTQTIPIDEAVALSEAALLASGAAPEAAEVMARALVDAEAKGLAGVGLAHLLTYCEGLQTGRIVGSADPTMDRPTPVMFRADAHGGVGHVAFERCFDDFVSATHAYGLALFSQKGSFTNAALDWFVDRLAKQGLVALAATNCGPAFIAPSGGTRPVYGTNPMAMAAPGPDGTALLVDQSSSATAFVNLKQAADRGDAIPPGWALDADGHPTTDATAALSGVLLAFGGARGANVALMVELLSAGLSGANWSVDAPSFAEGAHPPEIGLFVLALDPRIVDGPDFTRRIADYVDRLESEFASYIPGRARSERRAKAEKHGLEVDAATLEAVREIAGANQGSPT